MLHKFRNHTVSQQTKILILGTFHPDINNGADFFYGRSKNYLWRILPTCFNYVDLKNSMLAEKLNFIIQHNIDFVDLIHSLQNVPLGQEANYEDTFIDGLINEWRDVVEIIKNLPKLQAVYFTRKTFDYIPNIQQKISEIRNYCFQNRIRFCLLETPARYSNKRKIDSWISTIIDQTTCL